MRSCGMTGRKIEEMKQNGVPELTREFVEAAETVLGKMEERYGISFLVRGGTIPDWASADFDIFLCAAEGELAGKEFDAVYKLEKSGERCLYEGYFALLKRLEIQENVQELADRLGTGIKVIAYAEGEICEDVPVSSEEAMAGIRVKIIGFVSKETDDEKMKNAAETLEKELKEYRIQDFRVYRVKHDSVLIRLKDYESIEEAFPGGVPEGTDCVYKGDTGNLSGAADDDLE